jgi:hypothetical protein
MAWIRLGDTAATYPKLLEVDEHPDADESSVDEVFGWFIRIAAQSAQHPHRTDYIVTMATARHIGRTRARTDRLIGFASFAGLLEVVEMEDGRTALKLLNDPEFVHIKTGEVLEFEKQRRADNGKPEITTLVRMRDGDACRYCGRVVNFAARTGKLAGTYDHRPPGKPADAERSVVACSSCNATRGDMPLEVADAAVPLLPPPPIPYYSKDTRRWLHGHAPLLAANGLTPPALADATFKNLTPGTVLQHADTAPSCVRSAVAQSADTAPMSVRPAPVPTAPRGAGQAPDRRLTGPGGPRQDASVQATGTPGRDGSGRAGSGGVGPGAARSAGPAVPDPAPGRRRSRRGRKGKTRPNQQHRGDLA